jgi:hypothetical protein
MMGAINMEIQLMLFTEAEDGGYINYEGQEC